MKLYNCTTTSCNNIDCDYCRRCSHAIYKGSDIEGSGERWIWLFSPMFGVTFVDDEGEDLPEQPEIDHHAWVLFDLWYAGLNKH